MVFEMTAAAQATMVKMPASRLPEITGPYTEFAGLVRQITGQVTRRQAEIHSGVSHDTVARMWRGERVQSALIIRFALGYRTDPNPLLKAAGYPPLSQFHNDPPPPSVVEPARQPDPEPPVSARKVPLPKLKGDGEIERVREEGQDSGDTPRVIREPYMEELRAEGYYDLDDPLIRAVAEKEASEAYKRTYKSIADAMRAARRLSPGTVVGPAREDDEE